MKRSSTTTYNYLFHSQSVNNAGSHSGMKKREETKDGLEAQVGTNYIGHVYLTHLLLDSLKKAKEARVINVSAKSVTYRHLDWKALEDDTKNYSFMDAYNRSKVAAFIWTHALNKRLEGSNVKVMALHPGWVNAFSMGRLPSGSSHCKSQ